MIVIVIATQKGSGEDGKVAIPDTGVFFGQYGLPFRVLASESSWVVGNHKVVFIGWQG
jgi:hypothetical protein